jgi:hypothetical protein
MPTQKSHNYPDYENPVTRKYNFVTNQLSVAENNKQVDPRIQMRSDEYGNDSGGINSYKPEKKQIN